jgi:hypothetical protein
MAGGVIEVFVASEGAGITRLAIDIGPLAPMRRAGLDDTALAGLAAALEAPLECMMEGS